MSHTKGPRIGTSFGALPAARVWALVMLVAVAFTPAALAAEESVSAPAAGVGESVVAPAPAPAAAVPAIQRGVINFTEGHRYEGEHRDGMPDGRGVMVYPNRDRYEGEWRQGIRHGRGTMVFASGERYDGD